MMKPDVAFSRTGMTTLLAVVALFFTWTVAHAAGGPAPVARTGQTTSYGAGDDGALQKGLAWPTPRFIDMGDGTVFDALTSLIWMKNANCWGAMGWSSALARVTGLNVGTETCSGYAGGHNDWHLPSVKELKSLIDYGRSGPALPAGHPFSGVQTVKYWSGSTSADNTSNAWNVYLDYGNVNNGVKTVSYYVWPVRGGQ